MSTNDFITTLQVLAPTFHDLVISIAGSLITYYFTRGKIQKEQIEKIKAKRIGEIANDLLDSGDITHSEYIKCKNFVSIAKKADVVYGKKGNRTEAKTNNKEINFDLDWYIHFFEAASNISNEEVQMLWARVLNGEISSPGSFSLRTLETLYRMTQREAEAFATISQRVLHTLDNLWFVIADGPSSIDLDKLYDLIIPSKEVRSLQECGLLNPIGDDLVLMYSVNPISNPIQKNEHFALMNSKTILLFDTEENKKVQKSIKKEKSRFFHYYPLTEAGRELLPVIMKESEYDYILQLGIAMNSSEPSKSTRRVRAYPISSETQEYVHFDDTQNLL